MTETAKALAIQFFFIYILPLMLWSNVVMGNCNNGGSSTCGF
jgi:hypothetical protein